MRMRSEDAEETECNATTLQPESQMTVRAFHDQVKHRIMILAVRACCLR